MVINYDAKQNNEKPERYKLIKNILKHLKDKKYKIAT